ERKSISRLVRWQGLKEVGGVGFYSLGAGGVHSARQHVGIRKSGLFPGNQSQVATRGQMVQLLIKRHHFPANLPVIGINIVEVELGDYVPLVFRPLRWWLGNDFGHIVRERKPLDLIGDK